MKNDLAKYINQYNPNMWGKLIFQKQKENILNSTVACMQYTAQTSNIKTIFKGQQITLKPINALNNNTRVLIDKTANSGLCGKFDFAENQICINSIVLKDGKLSCETITHETTHETQSGIAQLSDEYDTNSLEWEYATIAKMSKSFDNQFESFGIRVAGRFYISGADVGSSTLNRVSSSLYALGAMERHASLTAMSIADEISESELSNYDLDHLSYSNAYLANAVLDFQDSYYCEYLSAAEIYQSIDRAQSFIAFGRGPINDLEANLAYDMIALLEYENSELFHDAAMSQLHNRMQHDNKQKALQQAGYMLIDQPHELINGHVVTNEYPISHLRTASQLENIPQSIQVANPIMIANFAFEKEVNVFPYLHCPEAFAEWLYSESSLKQLPREMQEGLEEILGEKYSIDNRKAEIAKRIEQQNSQVINEDVGYIFERD